MLIRVRDWKRDNPDKKRATNREHRRRNAERYRAVVRRHRALAAGVQMEPYSESAIYAEAKWTCHVCAEPIDPNAKGAAGPSLDHIVPISRGGRDAEDNIAPAHRGCNSRKGKRLLDELAA